MVVDTSALLALVFQEAHGSWVADQLQANREHLIMSSVNYAEVLILLHSRQPALAPTIRAAIERTSIAMVSSTPRQAEIAAAARLRYPLNLGDCFAYALAKDENCPLLTLDRDFRNTDVEVVLPRRSSSGFLQPRHPAQRRCRPHCSQYRLRDRFRRRHPHRVDPDFLVAHR